MRPQSQLHLLLWRLTPRRPSGRSNWGWSRPRRLLSSLSQWRPPRLWKEAGSTSVIWHWLRSRLWRSCNQVKVISMSLRGHYECLQCHMSSVSPGGWLMCVDTWPRPHNGHNLWPLSRHLEPGHKQHNPVSPVTPVTQLFRCGLFPQSSFLSEDKVQKSGWIERIFIKAVIWIVHTKW